MIESEARTFRSRRVPLIVRTSRNRPVTKSKLDYTLNVRMCARVRAQSSVYVYVVNQRFNAQYRKHKSVRGKEWVRWGGMRWMRNLHNGESRISNRAGTLRTKLAPRLRRESIAIMGSPWVGFRAGFGKKLPRGRGRHSSGFT